MEMSLHDESPGRRKLRRFHVLITVSPEMIPVRRVGCAVARNSGMGVRRKGPPLRFSVEAVSRGS